MTHLYILSSHYVCIITFVSIHLQLIWVCLAEWWPLFFSVTDFADHLARTSTPCDWGMEWDGVEWQWRYKSTRADNTNHKSRVEKCSHERPSAGGLAWVTHSDRAARQQQLHRWKCRETKGLLTDLEAKSLKIAPIFS